MDSAIAASPSSDPLLTAETIQHFAAVVGLSLFRPPLVLLLHSLTIVFTEVGGTRGVRHVCGPSGGPILLFFGWLAQEKPRRGHKFPFCRCVEGAEDVGAEHYGPDNRCSAQCNGIRRVQNSMQGHHSRSHGPEKETLGL